MRSPALPSHATLLAVAGVLAVCIAQFWPVEPTNFGGWDEWLDIDLASRGILTVPYQSRPLTLLPFLPGVALWSHGLEGLKWVQLAYLGGIGVLTFLICRTLPGTPTVIAFLAGVTAAIWAPGDRIRLDVVLGRGYAGLTVAGLFAILMLIESYRGRRVLGLVLASAIAGLSVLVLEAVAGLLILAPALLWQVEGDRPRRRWWVAVWVAAVLAASAYVALPVLGGPESSYQASLELDLGPVSVASRLLELAGHHLLPLVYFAPQGMLVLTGAVAAALYVVVCGLLARLSPTGRLDRRALVRLGSTGLIAACGGWGAFALTEATQTFNRTQFLSAPGVGLLVASAAGLVASAMPRRLGTVAVAASGVWVVLLASGHTAALQREWSGYTYWPRQNASLVSLTERIPDTEPNTLIILLDAPEVWPANFTFRHAVRYLYPGGTLGWAVGARDDYLYPARFAEGGVWYEPWPVIREAWAAPITHHRYDEIIVGRLLVHGEVVIEKEWPSDLPPLPPDARYAPERRIRPLTRPLQSRRMLRPHPRGGDPDGPAAGRE